jgi:alanyl-tRNA synthetase
LRIRAGCRHRAFQYWAEDAHHLKCIDKNRDDGLSPKHRLSKVKQVLKRAKRTHKHPKIVKAKRKVRKAKAALRKAESNRAAVG